MANRRGPNDRGRRERIARAAIGVVAERGLEGLTHRAVAAAADVPLGSTTYHFADREEMLEAALLAAAADTERTLRAWADAIGPGEDLVEALVELLVADSSERRDMSVVAYQLYLAALKRPALRPAAVKWSVNLRMEIERFTDALTAAALAAAVDGILITGLASGSPVDREAATAILRRTAG
ncbi:MAG: TetR family transcriptional regulator [Actinobacteria bacterium]|nr:TetR family transcriptional regulator [Actinomycetota bacterium]